MPDDLAKMRHLRKLLQRQRQYSPEEFISEEMRRDSDAMAARAAFEASTPEQRERTNWMRGFADRAKQQRNSRRR